MSFLKKLFGKKRKEEKKLPKEEEEKPTELEIICGDDKETYEVLKDIMYLDPRKIGMAMEEAAQKAKELEKAGDLLRARVFYQMACGLAIYEGNVEKVKEFFGKCKELSPERNYKILEIPERAVAKAREYYQKYLK